MRVQLDVQIRLRDGVHTSADLYFPDEGTSFAVLVCRTIYDKQDVRWYVPWAKRFTEAGYAVVIQDCRGRYASEGHWRPYVDEAVDGHDTLGWVGGQSWCDGRIGMFGISYIGFTQVTAALGGSPYLQAVMPLASQEDNYGHIWIDGVLQLQNAANFARIGRRTQHVQTIAQLDLMPVYRTLPLVTAVDRMSNTPHYRDFVTHSTFDEYWSSYGLKGKYHQIKVPACFVTGWYDNLLDEQFKCFVNMREHAGADRAREQTRIIVGPWMHSGLGNRVLAGVDYGSEAEVDMPDLHIEWYRRQFGEVETSEPIAPLRLFVMGADRWRDEWEWPLARTEWRPAYLASDSGANSVSGDGRLSWAPGTGRASSDEYRYDPENPVGTWGGQSMFVENTGPRSREEAEARPDVLVYSSDVLAEGLEIVGPIKLVVYASSSAPDSDFTGALVDVLPDGSTRIVCEGILRTRYRDSVTDPTPIEPGAEYCFEISLWETAYFFGPGHRLRLEVSSSNFPRFDRNLNTGGRIGYEAAGQVAQQTVFHDVARPSHLLLPVIPDR